MESRRIRREKETIRIMIGMYCAARHGARIDDCEQCRGLLSHALMKIERCAFHDSKPACNACRIHCYSQEMREQVRVVMRYSGPRMMWAHPALGLLHAADRLRHRASESFRA